MAVSYPLSLPSVFHSSEVVVTPQDLVSRWDGPYDLSEQVYEFPGKRWEFAITVPPMAPRDSEQIVGFLLALRGSYGTFYLGDTSHRTPYGVASGAPTVAAGCAAMSTDLLTTGWTPSVTGILKAGDWLQVGTGNTCRLHKVVQDVNSDGSGNADVVVWPTLRSAYASGTAIITNNPVGVFYLKSNVPWTIRLLRQYGIILNAIEAIVLPPPTS